MGWCMKKQQIIDIFGGRLEAMELLGLTPTAVYQWTDPVSQAIADRVAGACLRLGMMRRYNKVMRVGK